MHEMIFLFCFTTNSNSIYFLGGSVHTYKDGSEKPDDCALFFNWWCFCTRIYRIQHIIHHSHPVVLHSFRHCQILFSSYKRTTVCSTSGCRNRGISCLNTRGICRPRFSGFCDTRSTSLQSCPALKLKPQSSLKSQLANRLDPQQGISFFGTLYYFYISCIPELQH